MLSSAPNDVPATEPFEPRVRPARIGRFTRLRPLGDGGMGVVYAAYDEDLEREVAVKVLRTDGSPRHAEHHARMEREARLLAQLSHPNVVTVHEVGEHEGQIFIAMELVRGKPLGAWLEQHRRERHGKPDWRAVLGVFVQAGAGLAAAHQAGLVHRDFKPSNAMVGDDGTVKVLDFGLARDAMRDETLTSSDAAGPREWEPESSAPTGGGSLTRTGTVLGTPAYMAPEQHLGHATDERSDQYSFCVALYEALYGQRPFEGETLVDLQQSVLAGRVRAAPRRSAVPARIRRLLLRGLAVEPDHRHRSLAELLRALEHDPAAPWRRGAAVGGLVLIASTGAFALASRGADEAAQPCAAIDRELDAIWNDERRAAIEAAFQATGSFYAGETLQRVEHTLDAYATEWLSIRAESCLAYVEGHEPARHHDLRSACLARRRTAFDALVSLLAEATPEDVAQATRAASSLPPLATCGDIDALTAALPPPEDPALAAAVQDHRNTLDQARAHEKLGRFDDTRALLAPVIASAEAKAHPPLEAEALLLLGTVELSAMRYVIATDVLSRALEAGLHAGHIEVAAEAFALRIFTLGQLGRGDEGLQDVPLAQALVERADDDDLRWLLFNNIGTASQDALRYEDAGRYYRTALAMTERANGREHFRYAAILDNMGILARVEGNIRLSAEYESQSLDIATRVLGREHPQTVRISSNLALTQVALGRLTSAWVRLSKISASSRNYLVQLTLAMNALERGAYQEALGHADDGIARRLQLAAETPVGLVWFFVQRALALQGLGRHEEAMATLENALAAAQQLDESTLVVPMVHEAKGRVMLEHGDARVALEVLRLALSLYEEGSHPNANEVLITRIRVAMALRALGELDEALHAATAVLAQLDATVASHPVTFADARQTLGDILLDMNRPEEALAQYELGHREFSETADHDHPKLVKLERAMARAQE